MDFIRSFIESYLPPNYSAHGHHVDNLIVWTHYLMFVLFVGWGIYFIYTLFKFRASNNKKANYEGVTSHYSTYIEGGVILFEAFLIFALALPKWQDLKLNITGLMCIPPIDKNPKFYFKNLNDIAKRNNLIHLSIGMSKDYIDGLKCGASYIRIGTLLFGNRNYEN